MATYNSFADQIVREHAVRIGRDAEAAVLSESAAWLLMRRVVFAADDPRLETRGEALRSIIDAALRIARDGVDNLIDFDELAAFPERFADVLDRPSDSKRVVVYKDVSDAETNVSALALLARLAGEYAAAKRRRGVLDYSDQVAGALEVVRSHDAVAAELRDRFRVVLLDEYQDTSVVADRSARRALPARPPSWRSATRIRRSTAGAARARATSAASRRRSPPRRPAPGSRC